MYIRRKVFSTFEDENGEERLFSTTEFMNEDSYLDQKEFGMQSKALGFFLPGSYQAKEAAKYGYEPEEYKKVRGKYALKGALTPAVATLIKKKAERMAKEGKSKAEIRKYLENDTDTRLTAGAIEALTGSAGGLGHIGAAGVGIMDKLDKNRAWDKKD